MVTPWRIQQADIGRLDGFQRAASSVILPGRLPCHSHPRPIRSLLRSAVLRQRDRRTGDAPRRILNRTEQTATRVVWLLQHHQMLHGGLSRARGDTGRTRSSRSKERGADRHWDPVRWVGRKMFGKRATTTDRQSGRPDSMTDTLRMLVVVARVVRWLRQGRRAPPEVSGSNSWAEDVMDSLLESTRTSASTSAIWRLSQRSRAIS